MSSWLHVFGGERMAHRLFSIKPVQIDCNEEEQFNINKYKEYRRPQKDDALSSSLIMIDGMGHALINLIPVLTIMLLGSVINSHRSPPTPPPWPLSSAGALLSEDILLPIISCPNFTILADPARIPKANTICLVK